MSARTRAPRTAPGGRGWLAGYVLATFLSFPHPAGGGVLDLGLVASWLAPACLLLGLRGLGAGAAARAAFVAGLAAHAAVFHWIHVVTVTYGHAPALVGPLAVVLLALYPAAFVAAFGAGAAALARAGAGAGGEAGRLPSPWAAAALWAALDHGRSFLLTGFPWALLGYAQHDNRALLALAPYTGVYGLSFVVALGGAALADAITARRQGRPVPRRAWAALAAIALLHGAGGLDLALEPGDEGLARVRVAVAQGNIGQGVKWSPEWADRTLALYEELTRRAAGEGAQVVVWPETAVPGSPDAFPELADRLAGLARETGVALVAGALGFQEREGRRRFWDSAFAWGPGGQLVTRYDKAHLVPFGEYVPWRALLGRFVEAVARGSADTDVSPGPGPQAFALPLPGSVPEMTAGVPICYELLFPDLMRRFAAGGAEALFAITNDAWYGRTGAPYQFLAITELRAAESRLWIARAANTGVSALIDHRGRVRERTEIFEREVRVGEIVLRPAPRGGSFYVRHGDWFAMACWAATAILLVAARRPRRTA
ncbi:MAG: apolipoprotein N-acyltransferase [Deltaproteobacteria bacterium]|nr:apolipoprotein N-acyltransferase [Deltaproteobacteria bacterium]